MKIIERTEQTIVESSATIEFTKSDILEALNSQEDRNFPFFPDFKDVKVYINIPGHGNVYLEDYIDEASTVITVSFKSKTVF
jgi:hypothetical protein